MTDDTKAQMYFKATLASGKVVLLREPQIEDQEYAMTVAGSKSGDNQLLQGMTAQKELLKLLIVDVDGKRLSGAEKENLKALFTFQEYLQMNKVMEEMIGNPTKPKVEMVSSFGER